MKTVLWIFIFFISGIVHAGNNKKALLIGIGKYEKSGWGGLTGDSDVELMKGALIEQGFINSNIKILINTEADRKGIETEMKRLISGAEKGDYIFILFSGHGKQVKDENGDELDGSDEAIAPYDADIKSDKTLIIDDEIDEWISSLKKQVQSQGHIILALNSCNSGTGSKNNGLEESINNCGEGSSNIKKSKNNIGKFIALEASFPNQVSRGITAPDGKRFGVLTYSIAVAFENIKQNETYLTFFENVYKTMYSHNFQQPCLEGTSEDINSRVFDGDIVEKSLFYEIKEYWANKLKIKGGYLRLALKTMLEFRIDGAKGDQNYKPIAIGVVTESGPFESEVEIIKGKMEAQAINAKGTPIDILFNNYKVGVSLSKINNKSLKETLTKRLESKNIISLVDKSPKLELTEDKNYVMINTLPSGSLRAKLKKGPDFEENVVCKIIDFARANIVANWDVKSSDYRAEISLKHCFYDTIARNGVKKPIFYADTVHNSLVFDTKQQALFTIKNTGKKPFYFTLLDIQPDGKINLILPDILNGWQAEHVHLNVGEEKSFPFGSPTEPYGIEMYKVILSSEFEDFGFLTLQSCTPITSRGEKGEENPIVALFKDLTEGDLSRTKEGRIPILGGTAALVFEIIPPPK